MASTQRCVPRLRGTGEMSDHLAVTVFFVPVVRIPLLGGPPDQMKERLVKAVERTNTSGQRSVAAIPLLDRVQALQLFLRSR